MAHDADARYIISDVQTEQDATDFIALNQEVTGEGAICDRLLRHRPGSIPSDYTIVREAGSGKVVSTTCILPWQMTFDGVRLKVAMLEMVVTHPDFRRYGLIRRQIERFQQRVRERGDHLSIIQGIPYYYRQFGYGYALDHSRRIRLPVARIPQNERAAEYRIRPATSDDYAVVTALYKVAMAQQVIHVERNEAAWAYLHQHAGMPPVMIEHVSTGVVAGYARCTMDEGVLNVRESGLHEPAVASEVLSLLARDQAGEFAVYGNPADSLYRAATALGGSEAIPDQWLLNLPDPRMFLSAIIPTLERRLAQSDFDDASANLILNFYHRAVRLRIEKGRVMGIDDIGFVDASMGADGGDLCIPPDAFVRLVFGYRSLDELRDAWPDIVARKHSRALLDALFPLMSSWILMPY